MKQMFTVLCTQFLADGFTVRFQAPGTSMYPTIRDGERITVEPVPFSRIFPGDIVLYRSTTGVVAHRVMRVMPGEEKVVVIRGDVGNEDEYVTPRQILGVVVSVERHQRMIMVSGWKEKHLFQVRNIARRFKRSALARVSSAKRVARITLSHSMSFILGFER